MDTADCDRDHPAPPLDKGLRLVKIGQSFEKNGSRPVEQGVLIANRNDLTISRRELSRSFKRPSSPHKDSPLHSAKTGSKVRLASAAAASSALDRAISSWENEGGHTRLHLDAAPTKNLRILPRRPPLMSDSSAAQDVEWLFTAPKRIGRRDCHEFEIFRAEEVSVTSTQFAGGDWRWRLRSGTEDILAHGEGYADERACRAAVAALRINAGSATVANGTQW